MYNTIDLLPVYEDCEGKSCVGRARTIIVWLSAGEGEGHPNLKIYPAAVESLVKKRKAWN
jgi:hypothetical protein